MPPEQAAMAEVSVIIPAYRATGTIVRALKSVAAQTLRPRQVVVVDDGSGDGTLEAARACEAGLGGIELKVLSQDHRGAGAARNRAVTEADQPFVAFLDADDEWLPAKLERSMAHLAAADHVLVAHNGLIVDNGEETLNDCALRFAQGADPFVTLYRKGYLDTCTVVARRDAVIAAGGFDETLPNAQDFDMWLALLREPGTSFLVFGEALSRYHVTPGSIMSHTGRRLKCCLDIAGRYFPALRNRPRHRPGGALVSLWYRIIAVHGEAARSYRRGGETRAAIRTAAALPLALVRLTLVAVTGARRDRRERGTYLPAASDRQR